MTTQLESEVREALSLRATDISADVGARLRRVDYHPRRRRVGPGVTAGTLVGAAATAGIVSAVTMLGSAQPAFAGWSPTPSPTAAVLAASSGPEATCLAQLDSAPPLPGGRGGTGNAGGAGGTGGVAPSWSEVASDVRGPYTLLVFDGGSDRATCLTGPSITMVSRFSQNGGSMMSGSSSGGGGGRGARSSAVSAGRGSGNLPWYSTAHLDSATDGAFTLIDGQVASGVTGVTLVRSDGSQVQATTGNGWFVAWWPGDLGSSVADVATASGTASVNLTAPPPRSPGSGACSGGVCSGSASGSGSALSTGRSVGGGGGGPVPTP